VTCGVAIRSTGARQAAASNRVIRGGNFNNNDNNLRAANRNNNDPTNHNNNIGFRCAKTRDIACDREGVRKTPGHGPAPRDVPKSSLPGPAPRSDSGSGRDMCLPRARQAPRPSSRLCPDSDTRPAAGPVTG